MTHAKRKVSEKFNLGVYKLRNLDIPINKTKTVYVIPDRVSFRFEFFPIVVNDTPKIPVQYE